MRRFFRGSAIVLFVALAASAALGAEKRPQPLKDGETLVGRFVQERNLKGFSSPLRTEGRFVLAAGKGLIWRAEKPFETATVITASGIVQIAGGAEQARISAARVPFLARLYEMLSGALAGDLNALSRDFNVAESVEGDRWRLSLRPREPEMAATAQMEAIDVAGGAFVEDVKITKPGGDWDHLVFLDQTRSLAPLPAEDSALFAAAAK